MLILRTDAHLQPEHKEALRSELEKRTGEDCIILDNGLQLKEIQLKKEQPLWRRLFRRNEK